LTIALDFAPNISHAWFFSALKNGYFEDRGLEVDYVVPDSTTTSIKLVGTGRSQVGISFATEAIAARDRDLPVRVVNTFWPRLRAGMVAMAEEVPEFGAIEGKTVGVLNSDYDRVCFPLLLEEHGLSRDDVEVVDPGASLVPPLLSGQLAMVSGAGDHEKILAERESGEEALFWGFADVCPQMAMGIIANERWASRNAETLRAFNAAALEGLAWSMENPEEASDTFTTEFPDSGYSPELGRALWKEMAASFCAPYTEENGLGYSHPEQWRALVDLMKEAGTLKEQVPVGELVTNEHLPEDPAETDACRRV
jgi:ABC-type nitrate/sulfonate/bicarbonate transport system substrate-binding protein